MAKLSYSYNSIIDTPLPADQTLREMFTILEALKYAIDNDPRVTSYSAECTLYDHYKQMIADGLSSFGPMQSSGSHTPSQKSLRLTCTKPAASMRLHNAQAELICYTRIMGGPTSVGPSTPSVRSSSHPHGRNDVLESSLRHTQLN